jgi:hypothetical protein
VTIKSTLQVDLLIQIRTRPSINAGANRLITVHRGPRGQGEYRWETLTLPLFAGFPLDFGGFSGDSGGGQKAGICRVFAGMGVAPVHAIRQ